MFKLNSKKGFTLIELLVVISIISLLSTVVLAGVGQARISSRDAKRKLDLQQVANALELHYDEYGSYTQPEGWCNDFSTGANLDCSEPVGSDWDEDSALRGLVTDGFISSLPIDPANDATYRYTYEPWNLNEPTTGTPAGQGYDLCATLEKGGSFCVTGRK